MGISLGMWIVIIFGGFVGAASTLGITFMIAATTVWKIYRRIRFGIPLYN